MSLDIFQSIKLSSTYQAILQEGREEGLEQGFDEGFMEGAVQEARKILLHLGRKKMGQPSARVQAALTRITDLHRLEALIDMLASATSWHALLEEA